MESPPSGENPLHKQTLYRRLQTGLRKMSGIEPTPPAQTPDQKDTVVPDDEHTLLYKGEFIIPDHLKNGQTMVVFGRNPDTDNPKYQRTENEHGVKLLPIDRKIPQRAVGFIFSQDGTVRLKNLWSQPMTFGLRESQTITINPNQTFAMNPDQDKGNLRVDLPGGYAIRTGSYGGHGYEKPKVISLQFIKA